MVKYVCDICKEEFTKKLTYNTHIKKCKIVLEEDTGEVEVIENTNDFHNETL